MFEKMGIPSLIQIQSCFPKEITKNGKAVIECFEEIPCNPCSTSCPFNAITIGPDINERPKLNLDLCSGCGICVYSCPGLAIKVVQKAGEQIRFKIPYEFLPVPIAGEIWNAVDRNGNIIGQALIEKVINRPIQDRTLLVQVLINQDLVYDFAGIKGKA